MLMVAVLLSLWAVGCADPAAVQQSKLIKDLEKALAEAEQAQFGYVPASAKDADGNTMRLQDYRQQKIASVIPKLTALAGKETGDQRTSVRRLLADCHASAARFALREALTVWSELGRQSTDLVSRMALVAATGGRSDVLAGDESPLANRLHERKSQLESDLRDHREKANQAGEAIAELDGDLGELNAEKDQLWQQVSDHRKAGFTAEGEAQLAIFREAADVETKANRVEKEVQKLQLRKDLIESGLRIEQRQVEINEASIKWIEQQLDASAQRAADARQEQEKSQADMQSAAAAFHEQFNAIQTRVGGVLDEHFQAATGHVEKAVRTFESERSRDPDVKLHRLTMMLTHLYVLTQRIMVAGDYGRTLSLLADESERMELDFAGSMREAAKQLAATQDELIAAAAGVQEAADALADEVIDQTGEGSVEQTAAAKQKEHVANYLKRINDAKLDVGQ